MVRNNKTSAPSSATAATPATATATSTTAARGAGEFQKSSGSEATAIDGVRISCLTNIRYHSAREAFLDGAHRWLMFGIIVLGTGSFLDLLPSAGTWNWKAIFAAFTAVLAALDLAFDLSNRARQHSMMKRRYSDILAAAVKGTLQPEDAIAEMSGFNADEEAPFQVLLLTAWNAAQETVYGSTAMRYKIPLWVSPLKNLWRFEGKTYPVSDPRKTSIGSGAVSA